MKFLLFLSIIFFNFSVNAACFMKVYPQILHTGFIYPGSVIKKTNCPEKVKKKFRNILTNFSGKIKASYLAEVFRKDFMKYRIRIKPSIITVAKMERLLKEELNLADNWRWSNVKFNTGKRTLGLNNGDKLEINCANCKSTGRKNIKLSILRPSGKKRNYWLRGELKVRIKALFAKHSLSANSNLSEDLFLEKIIDTDNPEKIFTAKKILHYHRT
ncbi:MAG: hypothetical protein OXB84_02915, partial [Halobacteriovoraceae bacterium]|nr:hypothetical protein [Halobacteriovoraceae bacterium]